MGNARSIADFKPGSLGSLATKSAVGAAEITDDSVGSAEIAASAVGSSEIADGAVGTTKLANGAITPAKMSQPLTRGTAVATTSGTEKDFPNIPNWVKRITLVFNQVSLNASDSIAVRIGSSGTPVATGYVTAYGVISGSTPNNNNITTGFFVPVVLSSANGNFTLTLVNIDGNTWIASGTGQYANAAAFTSGSVTLSGTLDIVRITSVGGTAAFDNGSVNILYE